MILRNDNLEAVLGGHGENRGARARRRSRARRRGWVKAIVVLEPDATRIIDAQYEDQRKGMRRLARGFANAGLLREGWTEARATAALHALTSVETFMLLRRDHGLTLARVKATITEMGRAVIVER